MARARVLYSGKVQGVWFRANCQKKAMDLKLGGWVKNLDDGRVESVIEGPVAMIEQLIDYNRFHQPYARVDNVEMRWEEDTKVLQNFEILR